MLTPVLAQLRDNPKAVAIVPLNPIIGIPEGFAVVGQNRGEIRHQQTARAMMHNTRR